MPPTLAVFGGTGDCAGYCLAAALIAGHTCTALARTPAKLTASLKAKGVQETTLQSNLTIIPGDVRDISAVKRTLLHPTTNQSMEMIISGIGGSPVLQWSLFRPVTLNDPTICQEAGATLLQALQEIKPTKKPILINVSGTGIKPDGGPRDVPLAIWPLYHWLLATPHEDKRVMETKLKAHMRLAAAERGVESYVNVRPSLLVDGPGLGLEQVRDGPDERPAIGYTIQRGDVGKWMYEKLIKPGKIKQEWVNNGVCLTY